MRVFSLLVAVSLLTPGLAEGQEQLPPEPAPAAKAPLSGPLKTADEGMAALRSGDVELASAKLEQAHAELPLPTIGLWAGRARVRKGALIAARDLLREVVKLEERELRERVAAAVAKGWQPPPFEEQRDAQEEAALDLELLEARIPTLQIMPEPGMEVSVDGAAWAGSEPVVRDPGALRVVGERDGQQVVRTIVLHERDHAVLDLKLPTPPHHESATAAAVVGWSFVGVGVGAAAVGGVLGVIAAVKRADLDCPDNHCPDALIDDADAYNALRLPSGFLLVGGGLLAAAGVAVLLGVPDDDEPELALRAGFGHLSLTGSF
ncbi:MAG: hypothetical protein R3B72_35105 [Polyangiaceae bacterium]